MNAFDTLKIAIEADYSGLSSSLTQGLNKIYSFVDEANSQSINWVSILQGSFTPALIATIASTFAASVTQALSFQNQMAQIGANVPSAVTPGIGKVTDSLADLAIQTGQKTQDVADAYAQLTKYFNGNTDAASSVTQQLSELATLGVAPLGDLISQVVPLLQAWNVTTGTDAVTAINALYQAYQGGHLSFQQLTDDLQAVGVPLSTTNTSIGQVAASMAALSTVPGQTASTVSDAFKAIGNAVQQGALDPLNHLHTEFGSIGNDIDKAGIQKALSDISADFQGPIANAQALGKAIGISPDVVTSFNKNTTSMFDQLIKDQTTVIANEATINKAFATASSNAPTLGLWNKIMDFIGKIGSDLTNFGTSRGGPALGAAPGLDAVGQLLGAIFGGGNSSGGTNTPSDNAPTGVAATNSNVTYNVGQITVSGNGSLSAKSNALFPGLPANSLPKSQ